MLRTVQSTAAVALTLTIGVGILAQRPRTTTQDSTADTSSMPTPPAAPATVKAKYEGGVFGYTKKTDGTLNFEDSNERLVFKTDKQKELFPIPYKAITGAYADTHAVRPTAATIGSHTGIRSRPVARAESETASRAAWSTTLPKEPTWLINDSNKRCHSGTISSNFNFPCSEEGS